MRYFPAFIVVIIILPAAITMSLRPIDQVQKDYATVNQVSGLYVFIQSKPLAPYDVLGTVKKTGLVWSGKAKEMQTILIRRAKDDYPQCDGIVFDDISLDRATVIKFK